MLSKVQKFQDQILIWLRDRGPCSVSQLVGACNKLLEPCDSNSFYSANPIYWLVFPLLKTGILEYGIEESGVVIFVSNPVSFKLPDGRIIQYNDETNEARFRIVTDIDVECKFYPLAFLQSFPTISSIIETFPEYSARADGFGYIRNLSTLKTESAPNSKVFSVGLYKQNNFPYLSYCLVMNDNQKKRVPLMRESLDALNYASCYVLIEQRKPIFRYKKEKEQLIALYPQILPIFIFRALIQFEPKQLLDSKYYKMYVDVFSKVSFSAVGELQRIFSNDSVEVEHD